MSRLAVMAHFEPRGVVGPHVRRQVDALASAVDELVVVTTATLTLEARAFLSDRGRLLERENVGYDFLSYKHGLESVPDLTAYDEVVVCNDSYVPVTPYEQLFSAMDPVKAGFWGMTRCARYDLHVQSFFVAFRPQLVRSHAFRKFWRTMKPLPNRGAVIRKYEVGMSSTFHAANFRSASFFTETEADQALARRRMWWWAAHRADFRADRAGLRKLRSRGREAWNPSAALADAALDGGRLPYVKLDTLRYDPYGLGAGRLLSMGEEQLPDQFAGVRDFLDETARFYPPRPQEVLRATPAWLRPLRGRVEYRG